MVRDEDRRPCGPRLRRHRRDQPARAARRAGAALRSMGFGGMLIPLVSVAVVLTLLPALLSSVGPRVDFPRIRHEGTASRGWTAWARTVVRHRVDRRRASPLHRARRCSSSRSSASRSARSGISSLATQRPARTTRCRPSSPGRRRHRRPHPDRGAGPGRQGRPPPCAPPRRVAGIQLAVVGTTPGRQRRRRRHPHRRDGRQLQLSARRRGPERRPEHHRGQRRRHRSRGRRRGLPAARSTTSFPYVLALIALITFVLLVRTFRSILLPLKAVLLNLISLSAVFGCLVFFWQQGHGSSAVFGVSATGAINFWLPVVIFAFLFGLSMDYEVFILARMREEYDRTGDTAHGRHHRHRPHRPAGHLRRADPVLRLRRARLLARHGHQGLRHRARRRHPHRRHRRPGPAGARAGQPLRPLELVAARRPGACSARRALPRHARRFRTRTRCDQPADRARRRSCPL